MNCSGGQDLATFLPFRHEGVESSSLKSSGQWSNCWTVTWREIGKGYFSSHTLKDWPCGCIFKKKRHFQAEGEDLSPEWGTSFWRVAGFVAQLYPKYPLLATLASFVYYKYRLLGCYPKASHWGLGVIPRAKGPKVRHPDAECGSAWTSFSYLALRPNSLQLIICMFPIFWEAILKSAFLLPLLLSCSWI